jgi:hypothetical protein
VSSRPSKYFLKTFLKLCIYEVIFCSSGDNIRVSYVWFKQWRTFFLHYSGTAAFRSVFDLLISTICFRTLLAYNVPVGQQKYTGTVHTHL